MKTITTWTTTGILFLALAACDRTPGKEETVTVQRVRIDQAKALTSHANHYIGTVSASVTIPLSFAVTGMISEITVQEGERVAKGQLLASLDPSGYLHALQIAEAKQTQAEDAWKRLSALYDKGSLPEIKYIEVQTGLEQARAATGIARKNLDDCRLIAPSDGIIGSRSAEPGENAIPYQSILTLVHTNPLDVLISVPEQEMAFIRLRQPALISIPALQNAEIRGEVNNKGIVAQPISHTYDVRIRLQNPPPALLPGMVCRVQLDGLTESAPASVPFRVICTDATGHPYLFIPDASRTRALKRMVQLGELHGLTVEIIDGIAPGESYISEGYQNLDTTMTIQILH